MAPDLRHNIGFVQLHEDEITKALARSVVPEDRLRHDAVEKLAKEDKFLGLDTDDLFVISLLAWFKTEFFEWFDKPTCEGCNSKKSIQSMSPVRASQNDGGLASVVERYYCGACSPGGGSVITFPRYNHPAKLLETRKGRCGEWANCFYAVLRAFELPSRYIADSTDHVWCEFYSRSLDRWVHLDPCENAWDTPLVYEKGWGKKLQFVIAYAPFDVQDVTWRYTRTSFKEMLSRRFGATSQSALKAELAFQSSISSHRRALRLSLPASDKLEYERRTIRELLSFLTSKDEPKNPKESQGRQSGEEAWRKARGELGDGANCSGKGENS